MVGPIHLLYLAGYNVYHFDGLAAKDRALTVRAGVVHDPLAIGRPDSGIGENMSPRITGELAFGIGGQGCRSMKRVVARGGTACHKQEDEGQRSDCSEMQSHLQTDSTSCPASKLKQHAQTACGQLGTEEAHVQALNTAGFGV
jgi:hypothetical protein